MRNFSDDEKFTSHVQRRVSLLRGGISWTALVLVLLVNTAWSGAPGALSTIQLHLEEHLELAVENGLQPVDYHRLVLPYSFRRTAPDWTWLHNALDRLSAVPDCDPLVADELRLLRAQIAVDEGRGAAAREYFRASGGLVQWWASEAEVFAELEDFVGQAVHPGPDTSWRSVAGTDPIGWVRVSGLAWPAQRQLLYLATTIRSDTVQPVAVRVGVAQAGRVWLNGVEVLTTPWPLGHAEDQVAAGGWLRAGHNLVVAAVASEDSDWWLRMRVNRPDGSPLEGVRELDVAPQLAPAVDRPAPEVRTIEHEIRQAVAEGVSGARMALATYTVTRRPQPAASGLRRQACRDARSEAPAEARLLESLFTSEPKAARQLLEDALDADSGLLWARLPLAVWYHRHGLYHRASSLLEAGGQDPLARATQLDLDGDIWGPVALPRLAELSRRWPRCVEIGEVYARRAQEAGHWDLADEALQRLLQVAPHSAQVLRLRDELSTEWGDGAALMRLLEEVMASDPNRPQIRIRLARLVAAEGDAARAIALVREGLQRCPRHADLLTELARLEHAAGNDREAARLARQLLEIRPEDRQGQRLLRYLDQEAEDLGWVRPVDELWQLADAAPDAEPAVTLLQHHEVHFLAGNVTEERVQEAILVTSSQQADHLLRHRLSHVPERQSLRVLAARILRRDGTEVAARQADTARLSEPEYNIYYDTRLRVLAFHEFEDGDLVEISYIRTERAETNETGPYRGGLIIVGAHHPVMRAEVQLIGPADRLPAWELANIGGEPVRTEAADGTVTLSFVWRDLAAVPRDLPPAPRLVATPHLAYSNHPDWGELADWYGRHVAPRVQVSRQVEEVADRLTESASTRAETIAALYRFVTDEVRYVGLELGEHRFRPFSADWVLNHRIGDCKDKAALLVALLKAVDIPARFVLLRTADQGPVAAQIGLLNDFNHAIAYLPDDDLWLDGTATGQDPLAPPAMDQGAWALVIDGADSKPQTTPVRRAGTSHYEYHLTKLEDGVVEVVASVRDTGDAANRRRSQFAGSNDPRRFARWLQGTFPAAELVEEPRARMVPGRDPSSFEVRARVPAAALRSGGGIPTYPGELGLVARLAPARQRRSPVLLPVTTETSWVLAVKLGRPPSALPSGVTLETPYGRLGLEIEALSDGYRVQGEFELTAGLIPADQAADLHDFLVTVERQLARPMEAP